MFTSLQQRWTTVYSTTLPALALSKSPSQPTWPVHLDHCFARIILDAVVGRSPSTSTSPEDKPAPWTAKLRAPAVRNMSAEQLEACIELGERIANGSVDLVELDRRSLRVRGKAKANANGVKRKKEGEEGAASEKKVRATTTATATSAKKQTSIFTALGCVTPPPSPPSPSAAIVDPSLRSLIESSSLTPFRRRVLLALCNVPRGHYTTYLALSDHLHSSPRAVGNALRNNPFAPEVPCHRVVAADGEIGGFRGEWGREGKFVGEKIRLLRGEGVVVDTQGGRVEGRVWKGFV